MNRLRRRAAAPRRWTWAALAPAVAVLAVACGTAVDSSRDPGSAPAAGAAPTRGPATGPADTATVSPAATALPDRTAAEGVPAEATASEPAQTPGSAAVATQPDPGAVILEAFVQRQQRKGWETDFSRIAEGTDVRQIVSGGPPRDGIPSIDRPRFAPVAGAPGYLRPEEPVIVLEVNGEAHAYPLSILTWHEIVNDVVGGEPVVVTFCPLCNTSLAFPRTLDGQVLEFGVSGELRNSDLIMYDRQTQTWWQQATGEAIIGEFAGARLEFLPVVVTGWQQFAAQFPDGQVLRRPTDPAIVRNYDRPPYAGYDDINQSPFLYNGPFDGRLPPMARVATLTLDGDEVAYPFDFLAENPVINDVVGNTPVTVFFEATTDSAFVTFDGNRHDSGSTTVFDRRAGDLTLTFSAGVDGRIADRETGSTWNKFGEATAGELAGTHLGPVVHAAHFWFAWAAFSPDTEVRASLDQLTG